MKYTLKIIINLPRKSVLELFDSTENLWQPGLISFDHISGTAGEMGAMLYKMGSREIEMIETITAKNLHDEFSGTYKAKGVWNEVKKKIL